MSVSIIIPTRNRTKLLADCLDALAKQDFQGAISEIIVVDNGDDHAATRSVVDSAVCRWPIKLLVSEPPGVSRARNTGMESARGEVLVFLDDDEEPHKDWLTQLLVVMDQHPEVGMVAGDVEPVWEAPRPDWLTEEFYAPYSAGLGTQHGSEPRPLRPEEWVLEGNIAIKKKLLIEAGGFDEGLGRMGASLISGEGVVFNQLRADGVKAWLAPLAKVRHLIHADRLNRGWLMQRMFAGGVSGGIMSSYVQGRPPIPAHVSVNLKNLEALDFDTLEGEQLLIVAQIFDILGYICQRKGLL